MKLEISTTVQLLERQPAGLQQLRAAVYPAEVLATLPGLKFSGTSPQWSVFLWERAELVSRVGLLVREIISLWKPFAGQFFVEQPEGTLEFSTNAVRLLDVKAAAPSTAALDLGGLPW